MATSANHAEGKGSYFHTPINIRACVKLHCYLGLTIIAATFDGTLRPEDVVTVVEEMLEAENHSQFIGLKLKVPQHVVDGILKTHSKPRNQLFDVIVEYLKQVEPRPTWRAIADALRSPLVNLPHLAKKIEDEHCSPAPALPDQGYFTVHIDLYMNKL